MTRQKQAAKLLQENYQRGLAEIHADKDLSQDGRTRRLAELYTRTRREMDTLREQEQTSLSGRMAKLEDRLYGLHADDSSGSRAISTRDAQDRAAQLTTPPAAVELLQRAERNGDDTLARAVAAHAIERSRAAVLSGEEEAWDDVLRTYVEPRRSWAQQCVEELAEIERDQIPQMFTFSLPTPTGDAALAVTSAAMGAGGTAA